MKKVLVALDNGPTGTTVVAHAHALAMVLDAAIEAVHVETDGSRTAHSTAEAAAVPLRTARGPVIERLVEAGEEEDVVALAIGARSTPASRQTLGGTASAVAAAVAKPVLIVPPEADPSPEFLRVLVPLRGILAAVLVPRTIIELAGAAEVDVVVLHVYDADSIPAFTDQPQHEQAAWAREFVHRYCPWGLGSVRLETRIGRVGELVPLVAEQCDCDLIALGWSQELSPERSPAVREALERARRPVLLVPVRFAVDGEDVGAVPQTAQSGAQELR
jgi:nucleotide-binding universal stress UspA family protein